MSINHRTEAEKHLANAARHLTEDPRDMRIAEVSAWIGQGHAALAQGEGQAAATADLRDALTLLRRREQATRGLVAAHIAKGLASGDKERWSAARSLTQALDEADCNVDLLVDAQLADDGLDPRSAYKAPAAAVRSDDPWAPKPDITAEIPESVRRVIAGHLAEMLLDPTAGEVHKWARGIAYELKREGADLTGYIKERITSLTLGADPSDPPF
jgi:hypothetical protein